MSELEREYFNDRVGRPVYPGDQIVYAVRSGSSLWLNEATVKSIVEIVDENRAWKNGWRITVETKPKGSRDSVLQTPSRIVLVKTAEEVERERYPVRSVNLITFGPGSYDA